MSWVAVGVGAALSFAQASKAANGSNQASDQAYTDSLKATDAQNDAILQANTANVIRTGYRVGLQNLQKSREVLDASQQGYDLSAKGIAALGANQVTAAASGTVGSSVDAVQQDIAKKITETQYGYDETFETDMENANIGIQQTVMAGQDALLSSKSPNLTLPNQTNSVEAGLLAAGSSVASRYASSSLNLGKAPSAKAAPAYSTSLLGGISGSYVGGDANAIAEAGDSNDFTFS